MSASRIAPRLAGTTFEDQIQQLRLQFFEVSDGVHYAADLKERTEIPRHLRSRRQFAQQTVRLQVHHFLGMDELGLSGRLALIKFHVAGGNLPGFVFYQKEEDRISHRDLVAVAQPLFFDGHAVDYGPVSAGEVFHLKAAILVAQQAVLPRHRWIDDREGTRRLPAESYFAVGQRNRRVF